MAQVRKSYGAVRALDGLTLDIAPGELFGLVGPDGAGKTTALRLWCGLIAPEAGQVRVHGHDPRAARQRATATMGYVSQRFSLYTDLTVDENIAFVARLHGVTEFGSFREELLSMTGLGPFRARLAGQLSGGMKQKLALACTLVHRPAILILDEPTTGVDPVARREFRSLIRELTTAGMTTVLATPYMDEAATCDRVGLLREGRLLACGTPSALIAAASTPGEPAVTLEDVFVGLATGSAL